MAARRNGKFDASGAGDRYAWMHCKCYNYYKVFWISIACPQFPSWSAGVFSHLKHCCKYFQFDRRPLNTELKSDDEWKLLLLSSSQLLDSSCFINTPSCSSFRRMSSARHVFPWNSAYACFWYPLRQYLHE